MNAIAIEARPVIGAAGEAVCDIDQMAEQIFGEVGSRVSREVIRQVVSSVASRFQDARILTYVPIFVHQDALKELTGHK